MWRRPMRPAPATLIATLRIVEMWMARSSMRADRRRAARSGDGRGAAIAGRVVELAFRDRNREPRDLFGPNGLRECHARDLERIWNGVGHPRQDLPDGKAAFPRELPLVSRGADDAFDR